MRTSFSGTRRIRVLEVCLVSRSAPSEWIGWTDLDRQIHARYRSGELTVRLGPQGDVRHIAAEESGTILRNLKIGEDWEAALTYRELKTHTGDAILWPSSRPPLLRGLYVPRNRPT